MLTVTFRLSDICAVTNKNRQTTCLSLHQPMILIFLINTSNVLNFIEALARRLMELPALQTRLNASAFESPLSPPPSFSSFTSDALSSYLYHTSLHSSHKSTCASNKPVHCLQIFNTAKQNRLQPCVEGLDRDIS